MRATSDAGCPPLASARARSRSACSPLGSEMALPLSQRTTVGSETPKKRANSERDSPSRALS